MPSSAVARMGVRVALTGLWAGSGGTGDFSDQRVQTAQLLHRGPSLRPAGGGGGQVERAKLEREEGKETSTWW